MGTSPDLYAVIGNPIAHSRSPQIHRMFAEQTGQDLRYERLLAALDGFDAVLDDFFAGGGMGLNVTVPFKLQAFERARAHLSERARAAGAVNTLWMENGELHGCNTDGVGLLRDLQRLGLQLADANVLLVGAGGAARGALGPLLATGCRRLRIVNRTESRAHELAAAFATEGGARLEAGGYAQAALDAGWDLVINATAASLQDAAPDLPADLHAPGGLAYDMVYGAQPTPFMRQALQAGARAEDGLGMLVEQAAESFRIWRQVLPDTAAVLGAMRAALQNPGGAAAPDAGKR